jgi:hypothetical protein
MASAQRTRDHEEIRKWVEARGGIPTIVKGTGGLLRIDFIRGAKSGGREASLDEISWDEWFRIFDESEVSFLHSPEKDSKFFKLVSASGKQRREQAPSGGESRKRDSGRDEGWNVILVTREEDGWHISVEGDGHHKRYSTKADAVHHGRELARKHQPAELIIEKVDGEEEDRIHYGDPAEHAQHP